MVDQGYRGGSVVSPDEPALRWDTPRGTVEAFPAQGSGFQLVRYWGRDLFTPIDGSTAKADFERLLAEFGLAPSERGEVSVQAHDGRLDGDARLRWRGEEAHAPDVRRNLGPSFWESAEPVDGDGWRAQASVAPTFDLARAEATLPDAEVRRIAELAVACKAGVQGSAEGAVPSWAVVEESLAVAMPVAYQTGEGCEGQRMRVAFVDARTGAALRVGDEGANCVR